MEVLYFCGLGLLIGSSVSWFFCRMREAEKLEACEKAIAELERTKGALKQHIEQLNSPKRQAALEKNVRAVVTVETDCIVMQLVAELERGAYPEHLVVEYATRLRAELESLSAELSEDLVVLYNRSGLDVYLFSMVRKYLRDHSSLLPMLARYYHAQIMSVKADNAVTSSKDDGKQSTQPVACFLLEESPYTKTQPMPIRKKE